jgi:hypothetical protein
MNMDYKKLAPPATVALTAIAVYYLLIGMAVDAMDGFVEADVATGNVSSILVIAYLLLVYTIVIAGSVLVSARFISDDVKTALLAVVAGLCVTVLVACFGLLGISADLSPGRWLLIPALFTAYVLQNPATFLAIEVVCIVGGYFYFTIKAELMY